MYARIPVCGASAQVLQAFWRRIFPGLGVWSVSARPKGGIRSRSLVQGQDVELRISRHLAPGAAIALKVCSLVQAH